MIGDRVGWSGRVQRRRVRDEREICIGGREGSRVEDVEFGLSEQRLWSYGLALCGEQDLFVYGDVGGALDPGAESIETVDLSRLGDDFGARVRDIDC